MARTDPGERGDYIEVSPEMTTFLGPKAAGAPIPPRPVAFTVIAASRALHIDPAPDLAAAIARADGEQLVFLVQADALARIGGGGLLAKPTEFHLTAELRAVLLALREPPSADEARSTYRLAKSIEFLCETVRQFRGGELAPMAGDGQLSEADTRRMIAARQLIEDRAQEKLTLNFIARSCGLNRSKLTRGFRELFDCTVAQAIAERRLDVARRMLLTTDLPVSSVGYEAGYMNNASFARAFGRRFGASPSDFRDGQLAA
ncbi:MAG TPA: AraC family transcriptional regulator [Caulobacteraceae bacterium]|nr:AraC family transcriptional regulator [Caulobacteraceae bacterium]